MSLESRYERWQVQQHVQNYGHYTAYPTETYVLMPASPHPFIVDRVLPSGGTMFIYGPPKLGKSYLALQLAQAVSEHNDGAETWLGYRVEQRGDVVYLQVDTPRTTWQQGHLHNMRQAGSPLLNVWHADRLSLPQPFDIMNDDCADELTSIVAEAEPLFVVVDTLREMHNGEENDSGMMKQVVQQFQLVVGGDTALVFIGHSRKAGEFGIGSVVDGARGSSYLTGKMDTIIQCDKGRLRLVGRNLEDTTLKMTRNPYLWQSLSTDEKEVSPLLDMPSTPVTTFLDRRTAALQVIGHYGWSQSQQAREMAALTGSTPQACRMYLQKHAIDDRAVARAARAMACGTRHALKS